MKKTHKETSNTAQQDNLKAQEKAPVEIVEIGRAHV